MSLLMEALRKAEEAKSKAAKDEKTKHPTGSEPAGTGDFPEHAAAPEPGPAIINPDPDEEETLASHMPDTVLGLVEMEEPEEPEAPEEEDYEQIAFTTSPPADDLSAANTDADAAGLDAESAEEDDDDGLSLLQSSYFSRTQNAGNSFSDDEFDDADSGDLDGIADAADVPSMMQPEPVAGTPPVRKDDGRPRPAPVAAGQPGNTADRQSRDRAERDSASALFLAKEDSQNRRLKKLAAIAAVALVVPLAGIMFWLFTALGSGSDMQFNVPAGGNLANRSFSDAVAEPTAPAELAAETTPPVPASDAGADAGESTATQMTALADNAAPELPAAEQDIPPQPPVPAPREIPAQTAAATQPAPAQETGQAPADTPPAQTRAITADSSATTIQTQTQTQAQSRDSGLSFIRTEREQAINPDLVAAYESYQQADYVTAARLYQQVLAVEPNNRDALLHLATVHLNLGSPGMARTLYSRLLELNPRDPLARAGILETVQDDPVRQETELKSLVSAYPGTPQLSFALGNLYAKQNRWSEAQSAYFDALLAAKAGNSGSVSPDYAFNLAVSLERLNQLRAALDYYREAETLSRTTRPGFDPALLDQRLTTLEQRTQ